LITQSDDGQGLDPDDPLTVLLQPTPDQLGLPPGRYRAIRRSAARRRLLRVAAGVGLSAAAATLVTLSLHLTGHQTPTPPAGPLGPPMTSSPAPAPSRPPTHTPMPTPTRIGITPAVPDAGLPPTTPAPTGDPSWRPEPGAAVAPSLCPCKPVLRGGLRDA
jgi:hypothetical protein